jgi:hypothetical protein
MPCPTRPNRNRETMRLLLDGQEGILPAMNDEPMKIIAASPEEIERLVPIMGYEPDPDRPGFWNFTIWDGPGEPAKFRMAPRTAKMLGKMLSLGRMLTREESEEFRGGIPRTVDPSKP